VVPALARVADLLIAEVLDVHVLELVASRLDLYADVQPWNLQVGDLRRFVSMGRWQRGFLEQQEVYMQGRRFIGFVFGKGKSLQCRVYDRTIEIARRGLRWPSELWGEGDGVLAPGRSLDHLAPDPGGPSDGRSRWRLRCPASAPSMGRWSLGLSSEVCTTSTNELPDPDSSFCRPTAPTVCRKPSSVTSIRRPWSMRGVNLPTGHGALSVRLSLNPTTLRAGLTAGQPKDCADGAIWW
jgi:hypothetical protein